VFLGAGAGGAKISNKASAINIPAHNVECKYSSKNNFTWLLALGSSYNVTESIKVDVQYNYQDFGKTNNITITDTLASGDKRSITFSGPRIRSHSIKAGVRFEI
nr:porin family protein [Rickettsiaceae bacterium]